MILRHCLEDRWEQIMTFFALLTFSADQPDHPSRTIVLAFENVFQLPVC
jgi:hypothetical protein